jgi:hypothetical protein
VPVWKASFLAVTQELRLLMQEQILLIVNKLE